MVPHIKNGAEECAIKVVVNMSRTTLIHAALICTMDILFNYLWPMAMEYAVWVYNHMLACQFGLYAIKISSRSRFKPVSKNVSNCNDLVCQKYVLEPKLHKPGDNIRKWYPSS